MAVGLYCMTRFLNYLFFFLRYRVKVSLYHSLESSLAVLLDVTAMPTRAEAAAQPSPAQPPRLEKNASRSRAPAQPSPPSQAPEQSRTERRKRLREEVSLVCLSVCSGWVLGRVSPSLSPRGRAAGWSEATVAAALRYSSDYY
ncbi:hypothetical protein Mp_3g05440 [Marchantia polymorpha subsp. ruderalis]|uniref:Uncharacterized protein n=2 Tax=Marchantia polymorpha TaxID=3197 RepID=A0AAF6AXP5_MARPO|nr:hypothetical protein MARPO_0006s0017 [Marchantia polymorpha]BBN04529.1 hypothetical protein Mp_3g05440 [Marchantia polymorpha subsp. ruderalis]|eukprot:PTQ47966.1 hypothetical protein MARPO_0006s0017 [Marchantia polymorpha]